MTESEDTGYIGPLHVLIIGSGATGLCVAQGLKKNNISYAIYEKFSEAGRIRDWGMGYIWAEALFPALLPPEIIAALPSAEVDYGLSDVAEVEHRNRVVIRNTQTHQIIRDIPAAGGRRVSRRRLRQVLGTGLKVEYNKTMSTISYLSSGVRVHFEDGTSAVGTLVLGADGGGSKVRRLLLGALAEPQIMPMVMNNFNATYTAEQARFLRANLSQLTDYGVHPKGMFFLMSIQRVGDPDDPSTWAYQLLTSWPTTLRPLAEGEDTSAGRLKALRELTADFAEPRRSAIAWLPDDQEIPLDRLATWTTIPWDHHGGRVTLIGDAAHAMPFHRGQGLNNCIRDAYNLVQGLVKVKDSQNLHEDLSEFLTEFVAEVVERGAAEVDMSKKQTAGVHDWNKFMQSPLMKMGLGPVVKLEGWKDPEVIDVSRA